MKILMMTNTYLPVVGGLERSIQSFSEKFRARGHEVKIVAPEFPNRPENEKDVVRVPALEKVVGTNFSVSSPLPGELQALVEQFKPDVIHSHHPFLMGDLALRLCGQNKIPLVFTYHTMFEYYQDAFAMDQPVVQQFVVELAAGYANMADQVIVPSESVGKVLQERKVTTPIAVVPTGINVKHFSGVTADFRKKFKIPKNAFVIGHTGRLAPEKNLLFLTEAAAAFMKKKKNAYFLIIGGGPAEREMKKIFHKAGVSKQARFAGIQRGQALVNAYHAMDAFVFASKSETQGIVLVEAMAAALPVVALDAPGVREVVKDRANGRLLMEESVKKYTAALLWCASRSASQWNSVKKGALETAETFSMDLCAEKALKVYEGLRWREGRFGETESGQWDSMLGRFKTELDMIWNLSRAAGSALVKAAVPESSLKKKVEQLYQRQIKEARQAWTLLLKKNRQQIKGGASESNGALENVAETVTQKIRTRESELAELSRKAVSACDDFEKLLSDSQTEIKRILECSAEPKAPAGELKL